MSCQALSMWRHRGGPPPQLTFTKDGHSLRELVKEWEREKEGGEMRRPECARCGVWVCTECGWRRNAADRAHPEPVCHLCASAEGYWLSIRHRYPWKHADPPSDPLPDPEGSTR